MELKKDVAEGRIGEIRFIDASARSRPAEQGGHVLQLVSSYIDNSRPVRILGQTSGEENLNSAPGHPGPLHAAAHVLYENGVHVSLAFGTEMAQMASDNPGVLRSQTVFLLPDEGFRALAFQQLGTFNIGQVAMKAVRLIMASKMSLHRLTSRKPFLIG